MRDCWEIHHPYSKDTWATGWVKEVTINNVHYSYSMYAAMYYFISILIPHRNGSLQKRYKRNVVAIYRTNNDNGAIVNNPPHKYPWEVLIILRKQNHFQPFFDCPDWLRDDHENWNIADQLFQQFWQNTNYYDKCSGSLVTNKGSHQRKNYLYIYSFSFFAFT